MIPIVSSSVTITCLFGDQLFGVMWTDVAGVGAQKAQIPRSCETKQCQDH